MGRPVLHHRSEPFRALVTRCSAGLRQFLKTDDDVMMLAASGTGAMEAAVVNTLAPGDSMLVLAAGKFGERWADIGRAHGFRVVVLEAPWGEAVAPLAVKDAL